MKKAGKILLIALAVASLGMNIYLLSNGKGGKYYAMNNSGYSSYTMDSAYEDSYYEKAEYSYDALSSPQASERNEMLVKHVSVSLNAEDTSAKEEEIRNVMKQLKGMVDSSYSYTYGEGYVYYTMTLRIPADAYDSFCAFLKEGEVTSFSEDISDIYDSYSDNALRIEMYENKLERLYALLEEADNMSDMISIEDSISSTIYEIERLKSIQNRYDNEVSYSTFYININPVIHRTVEERSFSTILHSAFTDSVNAFLNMLEFMLRACMYILPYALIAVPGWIIYRNIRRHRQQ